MPRPNTKKISLGYFFVHTVQIERYTGSGAYGETFADPVSTAALVDDSDQMVRDLGGQEVVSSTTVLLRIGTADIPLDSKVTLPAQFGDRTSRVIAVTRRDAGSLPLPSHVQLALR